MSPNPSRPHLSGVTPANSPDAAPRLWSIPQAGDVIAGKYRVEGMIGQGGLAVILRAMHIQLEEPVAIKLLSPLWEQSTEAQERFVDEGRAATKIRSEHVVRVHDVGTLDVGAPYMVMECLDGSDLEALVHENGPLSVDDAVSYVLQAGEAIAEAHAHGIVHRDLKPANLFLTHRADGSACVKVLDFGISKRTDPTAGAKARRDASGERKRMTAPDAIMGSPHYMAPEQLLAPHSVDARCDVWALGTILYELLAGAPPYDLPTLSELYHAVIATPAPLLSDTRPGLGPSLDAVIARCMQKSPDDRYPSVAELAVDLAAISPAASSSAERIVRTLAGTRPSYPDVASPAALAAEVVAHVDEVDAGSSGEVAPVASAAAPVADHGVAPPRVVAQEVLESGRLRAEGRSRITTALALAAAVLCLAGFAGHEYVEGRAPLGFLSGLAASHAAPSAEPAVAAAAVAPTPVAAAPVPTAPGASATSPLSTSPVAATEAPAKAAPTMAAVPGARAATRHAHAPRAPHPAGSASEPPKAPLPAGSQNDESNPYAAPAAGEATPLAE